MNGCSIKIIEKYVNALLEPAVYAQVANRDPDLRAQRGWEP